MHFQNKFMHHKDIVCYILIFKIHLYACFLYHWPNNKTHFSCTEFILWTFNIRNQNSFISFEQFLNTKKYHEIRVPGVTWPPWTTRLTFYKYVKCWPLPSRCGPALSMGGHDLNKLGSNYIEMFPNKFHLDLGKNIFKDFHYILPWNALTPSPYLWHHSTSR